MQQNSNNAKTEILKAKKSLFEAIRKLALAKDQAITEERIDIYVETLAQFELPKVMAALKKLYYEHPRFPDISDIMKIINPPISEQDKAMEMAGEILDAIRSFGSYQVKEAREALGPVVWLAIERFGGWSTLTSLTNNEMGSARAQLRECCKSAMATSTRNPDDENLLPHEERGMKRLGELFGESSIKIEQ